MKQLSILLLWICTTATFAGGFAFSDPEQYLCVKIEEDFEIDGNISKQVWEKAAWTNLFVDIEGEKQAKPYYATKAKMLWSDNYLYFAFHLEEEHIWATLTQKDAVIYHDNDIEIFIDGDGDTHNYLELELNAFNTIWDLFLTKPYREGGPVMNEFDFEGLKTAIQLQGTINDPSDRDTSWTVEVAIPWKNLLTTSGYRKAPEFGNQMRINFSRVQWPTSGETGSYVKLKNPETGKNLPEHNWVWSPMGAIDMHRPEGWGLVTFVKEGTETKEQYYDRNEEELRQLLMHIYKAQKQYYFQNGGYAKKLKKLGIAKELIEKHRIGMEVITHAFALTGQVAGKGIQYRCNTEGKLFKTKL